MPSHNSSEFWNGHLLPYFIIYFLIIWCYCSKSYIPLFSGTHYFRGFNNNSQPWCNRNGRRKHGLKPINPTEEGLASIHSVLFRKDPFLWRAALLYYTVYQASQMSFSQLFQDVGKFVKDPNTRWDYCVRAKRGWTDTSQPGGFPVSCLDFCTSGRFSEHSQGSFILSHSKTFAKGWSGALHFLKWGKQDFCYWKQAENAHPWDFETESVMHFFVGSGNVNCKTEEIHTHSFTSFHVYYKRCNVAVDIHRHHLLSDFFLWLVGLAFWLVFEKVFKVWVINI